MWHKSMWTYKKKKNKEKSNKEEILIDIGSQSSYVSVRINMKFRAELFD